MRLASPVVRRVSGSALGQLVAMRCLFRQAQKDSGKLPSTMRGLMPVQQLDPERMSKSQETTPDNMQIYESSTRAVRSLDT